MGLLVQGCSLAILGEDFEATDLSSIEVGAAREDVESVLGKPESNVPEGIENIAIYGYDRGAPSDPMMSARAYLDCWGLLNIFCEPIMTPIAMVKRQKRYERQRGRIGIHYGADDTVMDAIVAYSYLKSSFWETLGRALCGDSDAQYRVGEVFEFGRGVRTSDVEAYKWYAIAASGDNRLAARVKDLLAAQMSDDQIAEAKNLLATWKPGRSNCETVSSPGPTGWANLDPPLNPGKLASHGGILMRSKGLQTKERVDYQVYQGVVAKIEESAIRISALAIHDNAGYC
jgi:hypothetical protein